MSKFFESGFTIIEAMTAVFVLTLAIGSVLCLFPISLQNQKFSEMRTIASQLAQAKMEEVISFSYGDIAVGTTTESQLDSPFASYSRQIAINYVDSNFLVSGSDTGLKKIEITVSWNSSLSVFDKNVKIISLIAEK